MYFYYCLFGSIVSIISIFISGSLTQTFISFLAVYAIIAPLIILAVKLFFPNMQCTKPGFIHQLTPFIFPTETIWKLLFQLYNYPKMYTETETCLKMIDNLPDSFEYDLSGYLQYLKELCINNSAIDPNYPEYKSTFYKKEFNTNDTITSHYLPKFLAYIVLCDRILIAYAHVPIDEIDVEYYNLLDATMTKLQPFGHALSPENFCLSDNTIDTEKLFLQLVKWYRVKQ